MRADFLKTLDGTGRPPTELQVEFLKWAAAQPKSSRVIAGQLPTGTGKSFILMTMLRATQGLGLASSNALLSQFGRDYEGINILKGAAHYECTREDLTCEDARELHTAPCKGCPYKAARDAATAGKPTLFNPMSLYSITAKDFKRPGTTIVDEAHTLPGMLMLVAGDRFGSSKFRLPASTNALDVLVWLSEQIAKLSRLVEYYSNQQDSGKSIALVRDLTRLMDVRLGLQDNSQNYVIYRDIDKYRSEEFLHIRPLYPPKTLVERVLGTGRVVLLSATLSKIDAELLAPGENVAYFDAPSPIPVESRLIHYRPMPVPANSRTDVKVIAKHVAEIIRQHNQNTLVHATYGMNGRLALALNSLGVKAFANTSDTKEDCIARFKRDGGVFVAAGCAEGLDLPDDECRVNILPVMQCMDPTSPDVQKWLALPGGRRRYNLQVLQMVQQQVGRSTRHVKDRSSSYICDDRFPRMYGSVIDDLPQSFKDAVRFTKG